MQLDEKYTQYANDVLTNKIVAGNLIKLACNRYLTFLQRDDIEFRTDKVERCINFIQSIKHYKGEFVGQYFMLQEWQKWIIYNVFGLYYKGTNNRVTKNVYIEVSRKNGKSAFASAICLYGLIADGEAGAEIEFIANTRKQARISFDMAIKFARTIDIKGKYLQLYRDSIQFPKTDSFLQILSSDAGTNDGWNSHIFLADEAHSYKDSRMYDVMKSSQGMRRNPLAVVITTAGFNKFSFCYQLRQTNIEILNNLKEDDTQFSAIYCLDDDDNWQDENVWMKSNPNLNVTVLTQYLKEQIRQAINTPSLEVSVRTKNLNQWLSTSEIWIQDCYILYSSQKLKIEDFAGYNCYCGVDLSAVSDLTAVSFLIDTDDKYYFFNKYYLPESALSDNSNAELYKRWQRMGLLTITEGNCTDYDYITADLMRINKIIAINSIAYDTWNSTQWAIDATSKGLPLQPFSQALGNFNRATKEFERLLLSNKVVIDDNEITRYCFNNVSLKFDHNDNTKPIKTVRQNKIDGVIAMLQALGTMLQQPQYNNEIFTV
jgi:phage terminase large subunit-like protein|nr:MAG TPA: Large Terminase [Caudoviricetes sp.]